MSYLTILNTYEVGVIVIPILQMRKMRFAKLKQPIQDHMSMKWWILGWFLTLIVEPVLKSLSSLSLSQLKTKKALNSASFFPGHKDALWEGQTMWYWESKFIFWSSSLCRASSLQQPSSLFVDQAHSYVPLPPAPAHISKYVCSAPHFFQVSLCPSSPK